MKVIMTTTISGSRGDDMWPPAGESLTVSAGEGEKLIRMGVAVQGPEDPEPVPVPAEEKAAWPPPAETAVIPDTDVEQRAAQPGTVESDVAKETAESPLTQVAPRRGPGRPRKDSLPS